MNQRDNSNFHILLVEDNEGDIILTLEALSEIKAEKEISVVRDGEEALSFLKREAPFEHVLPPNLVLLDINLPKVDGKEVLRHIKSSGSLRKIPVIMLTTSNSQTDINDTYGNFANCFITKPVDLDSFFALIKSVQTHWLSVVKLPS